MLFKNKSCDKCGVYYDVAFEECPSCKTRDKNFEKYNVPTNLLWLSYWQQIAIFLVGFVYGGLLFARLLFSDIFTKAITTPELQVILFNGFSYLAVIIVIGIICIPRFKEIKKHLSNPKSYLFGLLFGLIMYFAGLITSIIMQMFDAGINANQSIINEVVFKYPFLCILFLAIVGPLAEELTYRVALFTFARRLNRIAAYVVSILVFALIHMSFTEADIVNELLNLPTYIVGGTILVIAYDKFGLGCSYIAHMLYNLISIVLILLVGK